MKEENTQDEEKYKGYEKKFQKAKI
jgi:hypothetical protein